MIYTVSELDDAGHERWDRFVATCPGAGVFHRAAWRHIIEGTFRQRAHFLYVERDGEIRGVVPLAHVRSLIFGNALISNGYCVAGGPIATEAAAFEALDHHAVRLMDDLRVRYLEYRQPVRLHEGWVCRSDLYATFERPMAADPDQALRDIPRRQRAVIRRGFDNRLAVEVDDSPDRLNDLFAQSMHKLGTPVFPRRYFADLKREFGHDCEVLTALSDGKPVSSVISFYFGDRVVPYYTGSSPVARDLGANDFLYWQVMRRAVETRGCRVFDFGRSKIGTGPYSFKRNWGFEPTPVVHEFRLRHGVAMPDINPLSPRYRWLVALWKKLPRNVANLLGPHIVRNIG